MSSIDKLHQLVGSLAKAVESDQKIAIPILAAKLDRYVQIYPQDQTIGTMSRVISKMAENNTFFIRQADLKSLYNKLYARGTQFGDLFQEELGEISSEPKITIYQRDESVIDNTYQVNDQVLANALESVFDNQISLKMYSQPVANEAINSVNTTLDAWNLRPSKLAAVEGNDKFIVIKADYETPKGITSFYVPVEVQKNKIIEPEIFMGNTGPQNLNHTDIKNYLTQQAGSKMKIAGIDILNAITAATVENREITATELAVIRLNANRQDKSEFFQNQVVGLKVSEAAKKDVELPKSDEFISFEKQFTSPQGMATWKFGDKVVSARNHIIRELSSFGFSKAQVVITGNDNSTIFYGASLDGGKVAFTIPVKIANDQISKPGFILCNGSIASFDKDGINNLIDENTTDTKIAAVASTMSSLKPSEIINELRNAVDDENYAKAEDALNVLANIGDQKAYATGFQVYMAGLSGTKTAATQCSKMIKNSTSEHSICSHTGLPVSKVYQDKDGHCRPLYRKGMDETYEGASFMNAKIFG